VVQAEYELQLKVWEKVAVNKQMYMNAVTETLGLEAECDKDELVAKLKLNIQQAKAAKERVARAEAETKAAISDMEKRMDAAIKAQKLADTQKEQALAAQESAEKSLVAGKEANAIELKKLIVQLAESKKSIKVIHTALADTPENVVKKLKSLKKEKFDESTARKKAEEDANRLRKEKKDLEAAAKNNEVALENAIKLAKMYRELHQQAQSEHKQLLKLSENAEKLEEIPALDTSLLETIEVLAPKSEESTDEDVKGKRAKKAKK